MQLLALLEEGGLHTEADLAQSMGVSRELVAAMLADLERRGLLTPPPEGCASACGSCPLQKSCHSSAQDVRAYQLAATDGRRAKRANTL